MAQQATAAAGAVEDTLLDGTSMPTHTVRSDLPAQAWSCSCGAGGVERPENPVEAQWREHHRATTAPLLPLLRAMQLAAAMRRSAARLYPHTVAAVELLVTHGAWLEDPRFRTLISGFWHEGVLEVQVEWKQVAQALGVVDDALWAIKTSGEPPEWMLPYLNEWSGAPDPATRIRGVGPDVSDVTVLQVAASIAGGMPIVLSRLPQGVGPHARELILTAVAHAVTEGGTVPLRPARSWRHYRAYRRGGAPAAS